MSASDARQIQAAEVVLPCPELNDTLAFFTDRLGFRVDAIRPADDPAVAVIAGYGLRIRLERGYAGAPGVIRLLCRDPAALAHGMQLTAPNGTRVEVVEADPELVLPPARASFVLSRGNDAARWATGRAGMRYRNLVPDRQGGRFVVSHIQIPQGGPVADYVHFHKIHFQMIYCYQGWVRVVYEDQGPPLVMHAGDCVLQPPRIRHRVLECSPGLEVIEIGCPAEHETVADHDTVLPTPTVHRARDFGGQRFVHHVAAAAKWVPWRHEGFESRDLGIATASAGIASAHVARRCGRARQPLCSHDAEFLLVFMLGGTATLAREASEVQPLAAGDSFVMPARLRYALTDCSDDVTWLEVALPAAFESVTHAGSVPMQRTR